MPSGKWRPFCLGLNVLKRDWIVTIKLKEIPTDNARLNTLRPRQDGRHFPDDILKCIFVNGNVWISLTISLKYVRKVRINNIPSLVQIMAWRRPGDKPLSEPMMVTSLTHICVIWPQWVNAKDSVRQFIILIQLTCFESVFSTIAHQ